MSRPDQPHVDHVLAAAQSVADSHEAADTTHREAIERAYTEDPPALESVESESTAL